MRFHTLWLTSSPITLYHLLSALQVSQGLESTAVVALMHMGSCAGQERISAEVLSQWCLEAKQHASLRAMRKLMKVNYVFYGGPNLCLAPSHASHASLS